MQKAQNVSSIPPNTLKNNIYSIPEELKNISDLTDHNILDSTLHHHQQDANKYQKTSIHKDNPSFAVIIHKKKTWSLHSISMQHVFLKYNLHSKKQ